MFSPAELAAAIAEFLNSPLEIEVLGGGSLNGPITIYRRA